MIQYSIDGTTLWHDIFVTGTDKFIRFSNDNGVTWTSGDKFVGEDGDDTLELEYSDDNSTWVGTLGVNSVYIRFRTGGTGPWSIGRRFVGRDGAAGAAGNSVAFIYRADTSQPSVPTGGTFIAATRNFTPPSGWTLDPPSTITDVQNLYIIESTLPGQGTDGGGTITYRQPTVIPRGPRGSDSTIPGPTGVAGTSFRLIYQEDLNEPVLPTGGTWNGSVFRPPAGWLLNAPNRTEGDPENLYATGVELPSNAGAPHYQGVFQLNGEDGSKGDKGDAGIRGVGVEFIFREESIIPTVPTEGSGVWDPTTNSYTPPSGWSLDPSTYTGNQNLYTSKVTLPGNSTEETYSAIIRLNGPQGNPGQRGPAGTGTGGGLNNGDSIRLVYRRSNTDQDSTILTSSLSGGTWNPTTRDFSAAPSGWLLDTTGTATYLYAATARLPGGSATISYSTPFQITGPKGDTGSVGPTGGIGPAGAAGVAGYANIFLYRNILSSMMSAPTILNQGTYDRASNTINNLDPNWSSTYTMAASNERTWVIIAGISPTNVISFSGAIPLTGPPGQRGQQGIAGVGGGGADGNSIRVIYRRSTTAVLTPSGGSWNHSTGTLTPPSDWFETESEVTGSGRLYVSLLEVSGTADSIVSYSPAIAFEGPQGPRGQQGNIGPIGPAGGKGDTGAKGSKGDPGRFNVPVYLWSTNQPADPSPGRYDGGFIHNIGSWARAPASSGSTGQRLWVANIEVNPVDNSTSLINVLLLSGPTGRVGPVGPVSTIPGPAGVNGFGYQNYYHANTANTVSAPTIVYSGSGTTFSNVQSGWANTIPTTPVGANIFTAPVRYQVGVAGQTVEGVILSGTVPGAVTPPPSRMTYANGIEYGISDGNTPSATHLDSASFSLAVGESHTTALLTFPVTTTTNDDFYLRLPAGLSLTNAIESVDGEELSNWNKIAGQQVWIYIIGFEDSQNSFTFTVRRDT